jgi:integrase
VTRENHIQDQVPELDRVGALPQLRLCSDGYWRAAWTDPAGRRRQCSFGSNRRKAHERYKAWLPTIAAHVQVRESGQRGAGSIAEALELYMEHAHAYYRRRDGTETGEAKRMRLAMREVILLFGSEPAVDFTPGKLARARDLMVSRDLSLTTINKSVGAIRRVWRWLVHRELVSPSTWHGLRALERLKPGRTPARVCEPVRPANEASIEAACARMAPSLRAMVQLQLLTAMRPGEVCAMRSCDIERVRRGVWIYRPERHKTEHHGFDRRVHMGPRAQELLAPYLAAERDPRQPIFGPAIARAERAGRPPIPGPVRPWSTDTYRQAIRLACEAAGVEPFRPNQLRHNAATRLRKVGGLDAAQAVLGHRHANTTEIYAETQTRQLEQLLKDHG